MIWRVIGQSVTGTSHVQSGRGCEDALHFKAFDVGDDEGLICFVSDGAGSAKYAATASEEAVFKGVEFAEEFVLSKKTLNDELLFEIGEKIFDHLETLANNIGTPKNEFSCTLLGFILLPGIAGFLQIGDGAIVRNDGDSFYTTLWWPQNGEYQNTTSFLIDDPNLPNLKTKILNESISEIAVFTDGLQLLTLINETESVHQPFFQNLFPLLRKANNEDHISILNKRLSDYLNSDSINSRTDDDKTLILATRIS